MKTKFGIALTGLLLLFAGLASAQSSTHFEAIWSRFASGGGERQSTSYLAQDILGQWVSESPGSPNAQIVTDFFWVEAQVPYRISLPLVIRP